jgi:biopolymer transport protein ExbD
MKLGKKTIESEIFTGSMADISFLLIIYFMITSAFSATRGLDFALPEDTTQQQEIKQEDSIDVYVLPGDVSEAPNLQVDGNSMPIERLLPYVLDKLKQNPEKPVILRTDPYAAYGNMIAVFDELRRAKLEWSDADGVALHLDVNGNPLSEIKTISIPTQREIENIWTMLGIAQ